MSPRPKKLRNCNCPHRQPGTELIKPAGIPSHALDKTFLKMDELEAMRLCDSEGLSQQLAGERMNISRGSVQRLVSSGRKKLVDAIVNCQALVIVKQEELP
jgi:predicted DNA-binding protein (UPF0251 family)